MAKPYRTPMSRREKVIFDALVHAANRGDPCPRQDDLVALLDDGAGVSSTVDVMQSLERRGLIQIRSYQRSRQVTICASGKSTAAPKNRTPHWRRRPGHVPAPATSTLKRKPDVAREIMSEAQKQSKGPAEFLADLVWLGWQAYLDSPEAKQSVGGGA